MRNSLFTLFLLLIMPLHAPALSGAQTQSDASSDGKIIEQARYELPAYEQIGELYKSLYTRETIIPTAHAVGY